MNEQTTMWFLQKLRRYQLSRNAAGLWLDLYAYAQRQNDLQVPLERLTAVCGLDGALLRAACGELIAAAMLKLTWREQTPFCTLIAGNLYQQPKIPAG